MVRELERDHEKVLDNIQCIEYELDFEDDKTLNCAKLKINNALCNIENPLKVNHIMKLQNYLKLCSAGGVQQPSVS